MVQQQSSVMRKKPIHFLVLNRKIAREKSVKIMSNNIYNISLVDIENLTDEQAKNLYLLECELIEKYRFLDQYRNTDEYKNAFLSTFLAHENELFVIENNSKLCGMLTVFKSADWGGNEHDKLMVRLCETVVIDEMIAPLRRFIDEKLAKFNQIAMVSYNQELDGLLAGYSSKVMYQSRAYMLAKEKIDLNLLNETIEKCQGQNDDLSMVYTDRITEKYMAQYCHLFTQLHEDLPDVQEAGFVQYVLTPEKQRQLNENWAKVNQAHHCYMIFDGDEMIAKTNVSVNNNDPRFPSQFFICAKPQYRGRSLGKWMYAAMYKKLLEEVDFEKIKVHHHPTNKHAIAISEWMGYAFAYLEAVHWVHR